MTRALLFTFLISCGNQGVPYVETEDTLSLREKAAYYIELLPSVQDSYGFIGSKRCDSLLWTSLVGLDSRVDVAIEAARAENDQWFRRPGKDCYKSGESKSTISRDMFTGLILHGVVHERLDLLQRIWDYAEEHKYIMGQGVPSRTLMSGTLLSTLAQAIYYLGGPDYAIRLTPAIWSSTSSGSDRHLKAIHIFLREWIDAPQVGEGRILKDMMKEEPNNPLFAALNRQWSRVAQLLSNEFLWPSEHLPDNRNFCDEWPMRRDSTSNGWRPCSKKEVHSGGGLIFVNWLMENSN